MTVLTLDEVSALENAGRELEERSGIGSASSEGRDTLEIGQRVQEELERRSNASSSSSRGRTRRFAIPTLERDDETDNDSVISIGTANSVRATYKTPAVVMVKKDDSDSRMPLVSPLLDKVELAVLEAKRAALQSADSIASGSGSNVGSMSGSGTGVGTDSQTAGSYSHGTCTVPAASSSSTVLEVAQGVLPQTIVSELPTEKQEVVHNIVGKVVEKAGKELAEMQVALERAKAHAVEEAQVKLEVESKLAKVKIKAASKDHLVDSLHATRELAEQIKDERDDLHDKLLGMETLLHAKMERYQKEVEDLRQEAIRREDEVRKKAEGEKTKLLEELQAATKEIEKTKKQKIAVASERDVIRRAESVACRQAEAEKEELRSELAAAKVKLGEDLSEVLPDVEDDPEELIEKLKVQKAGTKRLSQEYERLRLELINVHQEKDEELAELKARVEAAEILANFGGGAGGSGSAGGSSVGGKANRRRGSKPTGNASKFKLSSIDEEDDDIGSQAGSGVSGRVSSDCDGVGDLRDFDDYQADEEDQSEEQKAEVRKLREELSTAEGWYKHIEEEKRAKDKEHTAKIQRLVEQMQAWREEALKKTSQAEKMKELSEEVDAQKEAEVAEVKQKLLAAELLEFTQDSRKVKELETKLSAYATQCLELHEQLSAAKEEKRIMQLRLEDTKRDLDQTENRFQQKIGDLEAQLRLFRAGSNKDPDSDPVEGDFLARIQALESECNIAKNELECQQIYWQTCLEEEQHKSTVALAKYTEERNWAEKERELKDQVEEKLQQTTQVLASTKAALREAENKARIAEAQGCRPQNAGKLTVPFFICPRRSVPQEIASSATTGKQQASTQATLWQVVTTLGGVAALFCADETLLINDASKKAFAMWGAASLRGATLFSLIYDQAMASWLKTELAAPGMSPFLKPGISEGFWIRELGCVEFRSKLGSAFDAVLTCVRLPEEGAPAGGVGPGRQAAIVVIIEPVAEETHGNSQKSNSHSGYRRGPASIASIASSVHSEDITANDSVSNVNAHCRY